MSDNPGITFPPPAIFLGFFLVAALLNHFIPLVEMPIGMRFSFGPFFAIGGITFIGFAFREFRNHKTSVFPHRAASQLISQGVFRITRNPLYLGITLIYVGSVFYLGALWGLILLPILLLIVDRWLIAREEAYLERRFGEEYLKYKQQTRRWI